MAPLPSDRRGEKVTKGGGRRFAFPDRLVVAAALLALAGVLAAPPPTPAEGETSATVVGAYEADVLACPRDGCAVLDRLPLDATVSVTGVPVDGYVPVRFRTTAGFVAQRFLYLREGRALPPQLLSGAPGCDRIALIFNIGSGYEPATAILDTLEAEGVPATMFVMGWWAEQNPALLRRMVDDGFPIGSHGHLPPELTLRADADVVADVRAAEAAIEAAAGEPPGPWFTPYAAAIDDRVRAIVAAEGYLPVGWTVRSEDWNPEITADAVYQNVVGDAHDGAIVELHLDASTSVYSTAVALPWIVRDLRAAGYTFVTVPEMAQPCPGLGPPATPPATPPPIPAIGTPADARPLATSDATS